MELTRDRIATEEEVTESTKKLNKNSYRGLSCEPEHPDINHRKLNFDTLRDAISDLHRALWLLEEEIRERSK